MRIGPNSCARGADTRPGGNMRNPIHHLSKMSLHEAAHAVIARALGIDLDGEVCMRTGDKDTSAGVTTVSAGSLAKSAGPEAQIEGYEKDAKVALAAPIAQERLFPVGDEAADDMLDKWQKEFIRDIYEPHLQGRRAVRRA